jgi:hypothetical protein
MGLGFVGGGKPSVHLEDCHSVHNTEWLRRPSVWHIDVRTDREIPDVSRAIIGIEYTVTRIMGRSLRLLRRVN